MTQIFTLRSDRLCATVSTHGARLRTLSLDGGASLVLDADPDRHPGWLDSYAGAIVGPIANRVRGGRFALAGQVHQMPCNENAQTALHAGPDGIDRQTWRVTQAAPARLDLALDLAHGAGGLPGTRAIEVRYGIEHTTLSVEIRMRTDRPTVAAFAHHPYWRLGQARAHRLQINATHYLPLDALHLPTGTPAPVAGTPFDHRQPAPPDAATDHNFCISDRRHSQPRPVATLTGAKGARLRILSTEPGLQVYAGRFLPTLPGTDIAPGAGLALEPQNWPDAVNHPAFPDPLCTPEAPYAQITRYICDTAP